MAVRRRKRVTYTIAIGTAVVFEDRSGSFTFYVKEIAGFSLPEERPGAAVLSPHSTSERPKLFVRVSTVSATGQTGADASTELAAVNRSTYVLSEVVLCASVCLLVWL